MNRTHWSDRTRHRLLLAAAAIGIALLLATLLAAPLGGADAKTAAQPLSARDQAVMDRISGYLNGLEHLQGTFLQIAPDGGLAEGRFYLRRPGRLRFEYTPPSPLLVVADGTWLIVQEDDFAAAQRYPIGATPLNLLLQSDVDLKNDAEILKVEQQPGLVRVTLADSSGEAPGELTLIFDEPNLQLRQWVVKDAQGLQTTVALRDIQTGIKADNSLFTIKESARPAIGGDRRQQ